VGLKNLSASCNCYIHHLFILLQGMEATTHVAMEIVPREQILINGIGIGVGLLLLLLLVLLLLQLLLGCLMLGGCDVNLLCGCWW